MLIDLTIGGISGIFSRTLTAPLELYKIQRQNYFIPNSTIRDVLKKEGISYLWKGNLTNCIRVFPQMSVNFAVFEKSKEILNLKDKNKNNLFSGGIAGGISMISCYPLETIRSRLSLQTNKSHYSNIFDALKKMPIRDMYMGLNMSLLGYIPYNALSFYFYFYYKDFFKDYNIDSKLLCGGLSGASSITITYPTDLIRRRLQLQGFDKSVPKYSGIIDCIQKIIIKEGYKGLYRGMGATYIKIFPTYGLQFWCMDACKNFTKNNYD